MKSSVLDIYSPNSQEALKNRIQELENELAAAKAELEAFNGPAEKDQINPTAELVRLQAIADILPSRIFHISKDMIVQFANKSCEAISLLPFAEIVGSRLIDVIGRNTYDQLQGAYKKVLEGETFQFEFVLSNKATNGEKRASIAQYMPEWHNGEVVGFYSLGTDVTDLRTTELKLLQASKRLRIITDNLPALISYVDINETFQYANKYYEKIFGLKPEYMVGKTLLEVFNSAEIEYSKSYYDLAFSGEKVRFEKKIAATDNRPELWIDLTLLPDINNGQVLGFYVLGVNQTNIKKAEAEKQKGYDLLQALIDNIPGWVGYIDKSYKYHFANSQYQKITTIPPEEINGKDAIEILSEPMFSFVKPHFDHTLAGNISSFEFEKQLLNGDTRHIFSTYFPNFVDGRVDGAFIYALDITEQKMLQLQLEEAVKQLTLLQEAMPVSTSVFDTSLRYVQTNQKHLELLNKTESNVIGKHLSELLIVPGNYERVKFQAEKVLQGESVSFYLDGVSNENEPIKLQIQMAPVISRGEVVGIQSIEVDITELHLAQQHSRANEEIFNAISSIAPIGIFKTNNLGKTTWVNERAAKILGLPPEKCLGDGWQVNLHPEDKAWIVSNWKEASLKDEHVKTEQRYVHDGDKIVWVIGETRPVYTEKGTLSGHIGILFDITEIRKATGEINNLNAELQEINATLEKRVARRTQSLEKMNIDLMRTVEELDRFAHIAAHDLKEPLRGIQNYASLLKDDFGSQLNNDGAELIDAVQTLALQAETLLDDLRVYTRIGRKRDAVREVDLNEILDLVIANLSTTITQSNSVINKKNTLPIIHYQKAHALTILQNLISNGIKYNSANNKVIEIGQLESAQCSELDLKIGPVIFVKDNGIGINEKHHEKIFEMFRRLHPKNRFGGGTGAGLALVRKIIEFNEGKIWLDSTEGCGTTFYIQFGIPQTELDI